MVTVTEAPTLGWTLKSISCVETSGNGLPSLVNSTADLANHKANIIVEEGEQIECTFTSEEIVPTAATADVGGRVVNVDGRGVKGVTLSLLDASNGVTKYASTNSQGYYKFTGLEVGDFYVLTAQSSRRVTIQNNVRSFFLLESLSSVNFQTSR